MTDTVIIYKGPGIPPESLELSGSPTDAVRGDGTCYPPAGIRETSGPATLGIGDILDGEYLKRVGATIVGAAPVGGAAWGDVTGTLSDQADLQTSLDAKQATLVSATNIKTINSASILGAGDLVVAGSVPETLQSNIEPVADVSVAANFSVFADEEFVIADGFEVLLETNSSMVIL